jgi:hypothetical protein
MLLLPRRYRRVSLKFARARTHREDLSVTYRLLMLAECRMDDTAVEQDLGCIGDAFEDLQCLVELVCVIAGEGCHPGFDFLPHYQ